MLGGGFCMCTHEFHAHLWWHLGARTNPPNTHTQPPPPSPPPGPPQKHKHPHTSKPSKPPKFHPKTTQTKGTTTWRPTRTCPRNSRRRSPARTSAGRPTTCVITRVCSGMEGTPTPPRPRTQPPEPTDNTPPTKPTGQPCFLSRAVRRAGLGAAHLAHVRLRLVAPPPPRGAPRVPTVSR